MEVISQVFIALDEGYITQLQMDEIASEAHFLASQLELFLRHWGEFREQRLIKKPPTLDPRP